MMTLKLSFLRKELEKCCKPTTTFYTLTKSKHFMLLKRTLYTSKGFITRVTISAALAIYITVKPFIFVCLFYQVLYSTEKSTMLGSRGGFPHSFVNVNLGIDLQMQSKNIILKNNIFFNHSMLLILCGILENSRKL